jgi:tetrahydromethanopterin S-methyltransferase subunit G
MRISNHERQHGGRQQRASVHRGLHVETDGLTAHDFARIRTMEQDNHLEARVSRLEAQMEIVTRLEPKLDALTACVQALANSFAEFRGPHNQCLAITIPDLDKRLKAIEEQAHESRTFRRQFGRAVTWVLGILSGVVLYLLEAVHRR